MLTAGAPRPSLLERGSVGRIVADNDRHNQAIGAQWHSGRFARDRHDALAVLARTLGHQLLDPETERLEACGHQQCQLVAAGHRTSRHDRAECKARIVTDTCQATRGFHRASAGDDRVEIDPHQRRGHHAE
jgi:hypothetical protein